MDKIRQWTLTISAVSVISGVLVSLMPKCSNKNLYKVISVIILIYAFMQPFTGTMGINFNLTDYLSDNYSVSNEIDKYALSSMINSAEKAIEAMLAEETEKIRVECSFRCECMLSDDQMIVDKITVIGNLQESEKRLIDNLVESLGFERNNIIFTGEDNER